MDMDSVNPNTRFLYYKAYGYALYWIGDFDAAIEALQIACGYRTEDTDIHLYLGNALWQANRHQEAMQTLRQGLKKAPSSIGLRYTIGNYARAQRDFPAAAEEYRALALLNSKDSAAGYYLGLTLYDMGAFKEAETVLKAIKFDSDRENQELLRLLTLVSIATKN
ncbi:MAG: hypothetical protein JWL77_5421 [Chthonomonadaceae bacterium]|nr:hypothetical protein [Chthonomonadaceae bacterium]